MLVVTRRGARLTRISFISNFAAPCLVMCSRACFFCFAVNLIRIGFGVAFFLELFLNCLAISRDDLRFALFCQARSSAGQNWDTLFPKRPPPALETFWTDQTVVPWRYPWSVQPYGFGILRNELGIGAFRSFWSLPSGMSLTICVETMRSAQSKSRL